MAELRQYRRAKGFTQRTLAKRLDVNIATVCRWEKGHASPDARKVPGLAKLLGLEPLELEQMFGRRREADTAAVA